MVDGNGVKLAHYAEENSASLDVMSILTVGNPDLLR